MEEVQRASLPRFAKAMGTAGGLSLIVYTLFLWNFGLNPLRTTLWGGAFSDFYDIQGRALLSGHLAVPPGSLNIEEFVVRGKSYMYFPPGPAIARLPVLLVTHSLDGRLTSPIMLMLTSVATLLLAMTIWRVRWLMRPNDELRTSELWAYATLVFSVIAGSTILFLSSRPWVYHEAYTWAFAMTLGTIYGMIGLIDRPSLKRVGVTSAFLTGAIMSRTTVGWAFSGALLLTAALMFFGRLGTDKRRWWAWTALGGLVPLVLGIAVNWMKFRHPYMFPLQDQVWTELNPQRRRALAANGGDIVSLRMLPATLASYLNPAGIRLIGVFPWITTPAKPAGNHLGSFLDQSYRTGSVLAFMPLLTILALYGAWSTIRRGAAGIAALRIPMIGGAAVLGGILFYGYIAHRYTAEFLSLLVLGSIIGATALLSSARRRRRDTVLISILLLMLVVWGFAANAAAALQESRLVGAGGSVIDYLSLQRAMSSRIGTSSDTLVRRSAQVPRSSSADRIQIIGACRALLVGTGDQYDPWVTAEIRPVMVSVPIPDTPTTFRVGQFRGFDSAPLRLQADGSRYRLIFDRAIGRVRGPWHRIPSSKTIDVTIGTGPAHGLYAGVSGGPPFADEYYVYSNGALDGTPQVLARDRELNSTVSIFTPASGFDLTLGPVPELCEDFRNSVRKGQHEGGASK